MVMMFLFLYSGVKQLQKVHDLITRLKDNIEVLSIFQLKHSTDKT